MEVSSLLLCIFAAYVAQTLWLQKEQLRACSEKEMQGGEMDDSI